MIVARLFHVHLPSCPRTCSQTDTLTVHRYADDCQLNLKHNHYLIDSLNTLPTSRNGRVPVGCACASTLTITSHPAQFAAANWQGDVTVIAVVIDHNSRHSTRPRCDRRQPVIMSACQRCVSRHLQTEWIQLDMENIVISQALQPQHQCTCLYVYSRQETVHIVWHSWICPRLDGVGLGFIGFFRIIGWVGLGRFDKNGLKFFVTAHRNINLKLYWSTLAS